MLNNKGERELAYIVKVLETNELPNYTNVHYIRILEWWCVAPKDIKLGDLVVYFEVDSLLPKDDNRFSFLASKKFRIKPTKICGTVSQGLVLPLSDFPELKGCKEGDFVTDKLHVEKYDPDAINEGAVKSKVSDFQRALDRHPKFFKNPIVKYLMKYKPVRFVLAKLFVLQKDKDKSKWPEWLPKTGSERIQNMPALLGSDETYIITEKCIDGSSQIRTIDGMVTISKLVNNKINTLVASYNESEGIIEYKKILNYHRVKQDNKKEQLKLGIKHIGKGNKQKYIKCTEDHKLLTPDGWKNAADLQVGDVVYHYVNRISHELKMMILGSLLGDACLGGHGTYWTIGFGQCEKQKGYFEYKKHIANGYICSESSNISGYGSLMHKFQLSSNIWLNTYAVDNLVGKDGKLELRESWLNEIDPIALAFWYMDDGHINNRDVDSLRESVELATCAYSLDECKLLQKMLMRFNIESKIRHNKYYSIDLDVENSEKFFSLIAPYIPQCMKYKLPKAYENYQCVLMNKKFGFVNSIAKTVIVSKEILKKKQRYMFDIEVEDNHNYFAQSVLVHNCDGASTSFILNEKDKYIVGSHNVIKNPEIGSAGGNFYKTNIWAESGVNYSIESVLRSLKKDLKLKTAAIQGETYGDGIQKRNYSLKNKHGFVVFHIWFDGVRLPIKDMIAICDKYNLPHVHVYNYEYSIPDTVDQIIEDVDNSKSNIDGGDIEGFVFYSQDGQQNFKCVSPNFLLKYHR